MSASFVLFGGTGYVGGLILAELLRSTSLHIILPLRERHDPLEALERIWHSFREAGDCVDSTYPGRVHPFTFAPGNHVIRLPARLRKYSVKAVINAAGSVHYFAEAELNEGNLDLTRRTLEFAKDLGTPDFVYVSSAFSAGYQADKIHEVLYDEPDTDPTYYTKTKRGAERMVATSGLPYIILRPSVLIGDSRTGIYTGKPYGMYQFLKSFTYFLTDRYYPEIHVVAPEYPFHLLHEDAFAALFVRILDDLSPNRIVNMVAPEAGLPTSRDLYAHFFTNVTHPEKAFFYHRIDDVPLADLPRRQRTFLHMTRVNAQITGHRWSFERDTVAELETTAGRVCPTTLASTEKCVNRYIQDSAKCARYRSRYQADFPSHSVFVSVPAALLRSE